MGDAATGPSSAGAERRGTRHRRTNALSVLAALACAACTQTASDDAPLHAWLQLGPGGERSARAITAAASCPAIEIDGRRSPMKVRAMPEPPDFPVLTCKAGVPATAERAVIAGILLPLPTAEVKHVAIIGDTGCRVMEGGEVQDCDDPGAWPFARLAEAFADLVDWVRGEADDDQDFDDLARSVAAIDPDLIVHVGDYIYREGPCPDDRPGCSGSPHGYDWETMSADFFEPGAPLLREAPLVFARGNHELCDRAGAAWFRFLDPHPFTGTCADVTEPWAAEVGGLQLLVLDSADAADRAVDPAKLEIYRRQFDRLHELAGPRAFLVTHRPMWVFLHAGEVDGREVLARGNATLQAASGNELPRGVEIVLSGHVHVFQALGFDGSRPPQVVVGNSGTGLDPVVTTPLAGLEIAGAKVADGTTESVFGFATLEADGADWRLTAREIAGSPVRACTIGADELRCSPEGGRPES